MTTSKIVTSMAFAALMVGCDADTSPDAPEQADAVAGEAFAAGDEAERAGGIAAAAEDEDRELRAVADADAILDEIDLGERASVRFIDERVSVAGGGVGMMAIGIPRFAEAVRTLELTPLELYLALAPGEEAPERLWEEHDAVAELQGRASRAPRVFRLEHGALAPAGDTFAARTPEPLFAQNTGLIIYPETCGTWAADFCPDIAANQGGYDWCDSSSASSAVTYAYTGTAGQRWLGGSPCSEAWDWEVQVEGLPGQWGLVAGTDISFGGQEWVVYTSTSFAVANYRSRVELTTSSPWAYYLTAARD